MKDNQPNIIAFDTSCDDTAVAVLQGRSILASEVSSQVEIHSQWGGVVPDIARREHEKNIPLVYEEALRKSKLKIEDTDYVVATYGPGLAIDLEIGLQFAKDLAVKYNKPFVPVNHMEGHLLSGLLLNSNGVGISNEENLFPALGLLISGKHTELIYSPAIGQYKKLGETLDDAVGEAFDKVARMLNFGYPGGAIICELAKKGKSGVIPFTVPMKNSKDLNFSYSGIKTAALYKSNELRESGVKDSVWVYDFCRGFLDSIIESLVLKLELAIEQNTDIKSLFVGGGVFNSEEILRKIGTVAKKYGLEYIYPKGEYRGDNAGMVGIAGYYKIQRKEYLTKKEDIEKIDREPRLSLQEL